MRALRHFTMCIVTAPQNYPRGWSQKLQSSILMPKRAKQDEIHRIIGRICPSRPKISKILHGIHVQAQNVSDLTPKASTGALRAPVGRGRRPRPVAVFVFAAFTQYCLGFGQVFWPFTCPSMDKLIFSMIIRSSGEIHIVRQTSS